MPNELRGDLLDKYNDMRQSLSKLESTVVAFSGGVDSSLVAFVAHQELKNNMVAVTSQAYSLKTDDLHLTEKLALNWGMPHQIIVTDEYNNKEYLKKYTTKVLPLQKCFVQWAKNSAETKNYKTIVNGTNTDDLSDYRPGLKAADEFEVISPLADNDFNKQDVRDLADYLGLANAQKPQEACLASRIPYGMAVNMDKLKQIELAEKILKRMGFSHLRVRHHGDLARIELPQNQIANAIEKNEAIVEKLKKLGFLFITIDLQGYRTGSLNEALLKK